MYSIYFNSTPSSYVAVDKKSQKFLFRDGTPRVCRAAFLFTKKQASMFLPCSHQSHRECLHLLLWIFELFFSAHFGIFLVRRPPIYISTPIVCAPNSICSICPYKKMKNSISGFHSCKVCELQISDILCRCILKVHCTKIKPGV